jgi:hypothetical protein
MWAGRAGCAIAIGGVVALGVWRPAAPVDVDRLAQVQDRRMCVALDAILDVAFVGISPPPDASPEDFAATVRINARLAQMRETLRASEMVREMGC